VCSVQCNARVVRLMTKASFFSLGLGERTMLLGLFMVGVVGTEL
jgi:hypothetical protein